MDGKPDGPGPTPAGEGAASRVQPLLTVNRPILSLLPAIGHRETGDRYHIDTMTHAREQQIAAGDAPPPELG